MLALIKRWWLPTLAAGLTLALFPVLNIQPLRAAYINALTFKSRHFQRPLVSMLGDSLTDRAAPWGLRLSWNPLAAFTMAHGGFRTRDIERLAIEATSVNPRYFHIEAGANDLDPGTTPAMYVADFVRILDDIKAPGERVIVTLIPPGGDPKQNRQARTFNAALLPILVQRHIRTIDLEPLIASKGVIRPEMTNDGRHFTEAANKIWAAEIHKLLT